MKDVDSGPSCHLSDQPSQLSNKQTTMACGLTSIWSSSLHPTTRKVKRHESGKRQMRDRSLTSPRSTRVSPDLTGVNAS